MTDNMAKWFEQRKRLHEIERKAADAIPNSATEVSSRSPLAEEGGAGFRPSPATNPHATPNSAAIDAAYHRGYAAAERSALMMLTMAVEAAGGEVIIAPKMTKGSNRLERYDDPTTDQIRLRVVTDA